MSRVKEDLSWVSLNQLCVLTGKTSRTVKKLLSEIKPREESGTLLYKSSEVLPIIYGIGKPGDEKLDSWQEKARYDSLRADKVQIEIDIMKENLIPADRVERAWQKLLATLRARLLTLPSRLAPRLVGINEASELERHIRTDVYEALEELSKHDDGIDRGQNPEKSTQGPSSTT